MCFLLERPRTGNGNLVDVGSGQSHQSREPVGDVEQVCRDSSAALQQRTVDEGHSSQAALPVCALGQTHGLNWEQSLTAKPVKKK